MHTVCRYNGNNVIDRMTVRWSKFMLRKRTKRLPPMPIEDILTIIKTSEKAET
jgi:hypothetical protein